MINATMAYLRRNNKTLLLLRNDGPKDRHQGYYVPPGGRFERNERGVDCILREYEEETGLTLVEPRLKALTTFFNRGRKLGGEMDSEDWQVEVYAADSFKGKLRPEKENSPPIWVSDSKIDSVNMYPGDRMIMELLKINGIWEVITEYRGEEMIRFDSKRVD